MSRTIKWSLTLITVVLLSGVAFIINPSPVTPQNTSDTQHIKWKDHGFGLDIPSSWRVYMRDEILVMADINELNKDMIPAAIDAGNYRLQYSAYPEVAIFIHANTTVEDRVKELGDCQSDRTGRFVQVDCERPLPGRNRAENVRFYLFNIQQTVYEVAVGSIALRQNPDEVQALIHSITFD